MVAIIIATVPVASSIGLSAITATAIAIIPDRAAANVGQIHRYPLQRSYAGELTACQTKCVVIHANLGRQINRKFVHHWGRLHQSRDREGTTA